MIRLDVTGLSREFIKTSALGNFVNLVSADLTVGTSTNLCPPDINFSFHEIVSVGAGGRNRTGTPIQEQDFKSCVSTNSTTPAD